MSISHHHHQRCSGLRDTSSGFSTSDPSVAVGHGGLLEKKGALSSFGSAHRKWVLKRKARAGGGRQLALKQGVDQLPLTLPGPCCRSRWP